MYQEVVEEQQGEVPILAEHQNLVLGFLANIEADPNAEEFHAPVDFRGLELHDYPEVVKNPMDLGTLKRNFNAGHYVTFEQLLTDMQLIWDNCKLYNYPGMYKLATCMERVAKRETNKFIVANNLQ